jgi:hypothetical protein
MPKKNVKVCLMCLGRVYKDWVPLKSMESGRYTFKPWRTKCSKCEEEYTLQEFENFLVDWR